MTQIEAKGHTGRVVFDGHAVTIYREGLLARSAVGKGQKQIPIDSISAVQWKPAGALVNGFVQFTVSGGVERRSKPGSSTTDAAKDENSVVFTKKQMPDFEALRDAIQAAKAQRVANGPAVVGAAGPTAAERIHQLAGLRDQGLITDAEYEAKRQELLGQL